MPVNLNGIAESLALVSASADDPSPPIPQPAASEDSESTMAPKPSINQLRSKQITSQYVS
jgi:hypothetical protein